SPSEACTASAAEKASSEPSLARKPLPSSASACSASALSKLPPPGSGCGANLRAAAASWCWGDAEKPPGSVAMSVEGRRMQDSVPELRDGLPMEVTSPAWDLE
ncbi:hypothetical protein H8958_012454, partial [Nasalis larvatus]